MNKRMSRWSLGERCILSGKYKSSETFKYASSYSFISIMFEYSLIQLKSVNLINSKNPHVLYLKLSDCFYKNPQLERKKIYLVLGRTNDCLPHDQLVDYSMFDP